MAITTLSQLDMREVRRTIAKVSQLHEDDVIDGNGETDVSKRKFFVSVNQLTSDPIGTEIKFDATNEKEIVTSTYETSISINAFGRNAYLIIEKISTSIRTSYAQQLFKRIGVGVVRSSQIRNLPTAIAGGKEQRAQFDLVLSHIHRIEAPLNRGESVVITTQKD
ncbi:phage neck terminator protein [Proteus terrae]|uniref:phage neck terminator protein n=1 Tax=Proteus terrae TaxID=1574161 RepID=UPI00301D68CE